MSTEVKMLNSKYLLYFNQVFQRFMNVIELNNNDYAFYRGELFSTDEDDYIHLCWLVTDIDGVYKLKSIEYDDETGEIFCDKKFSFLNPNAVSSAIHTLLEDIEKFQLPLSHVYFETFRGYRASRIVKDPKEKGSYILYLISSDTEDILGSYLTGSIKRNTELIGNWNKSLNV